MSAPLPLTVNHLHKYIYMQETDKKKIDHRNLEFLWGHVQYVNIICHGNCIELQMKCFITHDLFLHIWL